MWLSIGRHFSVWGKTYKPAYRQRVLSVSRQCLLKYSKFPGMDKPEQAGVNLLSQGRGEGGEAELKIGCQIPHCQPSSFQHSLGQSFMEHLC